MSEYNQAYTKQLIDQLCKGQRKAQYELYKNYVGMVFHTAYRMVTNKTDAEEIVQETFIKVYQKIKGFKQESSLGWWIKRIAIHTAINQLEKKKKMNWVLVEDQTAMNIPGFQHLDEIENEVEKISLADIQNAVLKLPDGCRTVFNLYAFEGYTHDEVSEILGISSSTSKTQYRRARLLLRPLLKEKV